MYGTDTTNDVTLTATPSSDVSSPTTTHMTLYIVVAAAFVVFVVVIGVVIKVMKRKNANPNGYTLTSTGKQLVEPFTDQVTSCALSAALAT